MAKIYITDTILRDAHQSQAATRMRLSARLHPYFQSLHTTGNFSIREQGRRFCSRHLTTYHPKATAQNTPCLLPRNSDRRNKI